MLIHESTHYYGYFSATLVIRKQPQNRDKCIRMFVISRSTYECAKTNDLAVEL
jgi:hypothetical protein